MIFGTWEQREPFFNFSNSFKVFSFLFAPKRMKKKKFFLKRHLAWPTLTIHYSSISTLYWTVFSTADSYACYNNIINFSFYMENEILV